MAVAKKSENKKDLDNRIRTKNDSRTSEKEEALDMALKQIEKQFGKGAVMKLGDDTGLNIETISTGSISLDIATGVGGIPRGRITEIYGPESSGKTTLALHVIAEAQKTGGRAAFIDAEHALDPEYASKLGVDVNELLVAQPDTGEQALEICEMLVRSGAIDVVVVDSVAALVPKAEIQGEMGESHVGLHARLMSQALRKLAGVINKSNTCAIFINQLREKVGVMFGSPEVTTGGRALKFYATMRIDVRRIEGIKQGDQFIGNRTRVKIVKNKVAPPFKQAEFDIMYGHGISREGDGLDCAVAYKIVDKAGAWYSYEGNRIGQGRENVKKFLQENPEILNRIEEQIREKLSPSADNNSQQSDTAEKSAIKSDEGFAENDKNILHDISDSVGLIDEEAPIIDPETGEILA
jgi:recombination protein RecA